MNRQCITRQEFIKLYKNSLFEISQFFEENNIEYSLGYGTLLGAYREHDIIPWDIDIDLFVTHESTLKILRFEKKLPAYFKFETYLRDEFIIYLSRIYDSRLIFDTKSRENINVHIDLFEVDNIKNFKGINKLKKYYLKSYHFLQFKNRKKGRNAFVTIARTICSLFIPSLKATNKRLLKKFSKIEKGNDICGSFLLIEKTAPAFAGYSKLKFGDKEYNCYSNAKDILKALYGDNFMTPIDDGRSKVIYQYYCAK